MSRTNSALARQVVPLVPKTPTAQLSSPQQSPPGQKFDLILSSMNAQPLNLAILTPRLAKLFGVSPETIGQLLNRTPALLPVRLTWSQTQELSHVLSQYGIRALPQPSLDYTNNKPAGNRQTNKAPHQAGRASRPSSNPSAPNKRIQSSSAQIETSLWRGFGNALAVSLCSFSYAALLLATAIGIEWHVATHQYWLNPQLPASFQFFFFALLAFGFTMLLLFLKPIITFAQRATPLWLSAPETTPFLAKFMLALEQPGALPLRPSEHHSAIVARVTLRSTRNQPGNKPGPAMVVDTAIPDPLHTSYFAITRLLVKSLSRAPQSRSLALAIWSEQVRFGLWHLAYARDHWDLAIEERLVRSHNITAAALLSVEACFLLGRLPLVALYQLSTVLTRSQVRLANVEFFPVPRIPKRNRRD